LKKDVNYLQKVISTKNKMKN
jgi:hypothetical protein